AADAQKGGQEESKVSSAHRVCTAQKVQADTETRCMICQKEQQPISRAYLWTRRICRKMYGWNIGGGESAAATRPQFSVFLPLRQPGICITTSSKSCRMRTRRTTGYRKKSDICWRIWWRRYSM